VTENDVGGRRRAAGKTQRGDTSCGMNLKSKHATLLNAEHNHEQIQRVLHMPFSH
jgi:hypothetical protein